MRIKVIITLTHSRANMEKQILKVTLFLLSVITGVDLVETNKTLLLSPSELQEIFKDLEKLWTTEANEVLPPDPVHGIQLRPSEASIGLVGQRTKIKVIVDQSLSVDQDRKLVVTSGNRRIFGVLTKEIILPGKKNGNITQQHAVAEDGLSIVLLGFRPGRARLFVQVNSVMAHFYHCPC